MSVVPTQIGPYRVLRPIAAGGMAEVFEVEDPVTGERLALKWLVAVKVALKRFNREYEAMTRLNHQGVVRVYHYGISDGHPWITMELLRGVPAQSALKRVGKPGSPERTAEVLRVGYRIASALAYIHDRGMIHRDLKSANVLVLPDRRVKLLDFGAAFLVDAVDRITAENEFVGTFSYASPEQIKGEAFDYRSDLYSLGVLLFRMATGKKVFEEGNPDELARAVVLQTPPNPADLVPSLPDGLCELITHLLAKKAISRPPSARFVASRLEVLAGRTFSSKSRIAVQEPVAVIRHEELREVLASVTTPGASLVWIAGESGSDRQRLLGDVRKQLKADGNTLLSLSAARDPYGMVLDALLEVAKKHPELIVFRQWLERAEVAEALPVALRGEVQQAAVEVLAHHLENLPEIAPPWVILVPDVESLDEQTVDLLAAFWKRAREMGGALKLIASVPRSALAQREGLRRRFPEGHRVVLAPLSPRQVAVAVGNMLGRRPPPADIAQKLHAATSGQPLYLERAVMDLAASGHVAADGDRLAWAEQRVEIPVPRAARADTDAKLADLPVVAARVLQAVAVCQDAAMPVVVARSMGWSIEELGPVLQILIDAGFVHLDLRSGATLSWRDPVARDVVLEGLEPARLRLFQRRVASALTESVPSAAQVHCLTAIDELDRAADAALKFVESALQEGRIRSAFQVLEPLVRRPGLRSGFVWGDIYRLHSYCLRSVRPTDPGVARSLGLSARFMAPEDLSRQARLLLEQARRNVVIGHYGNFRKYLEEAAETAPEDDHGLSALLSTELVTAHQRKGDAGGARRWAAMAISAAEKSGKPRLIALAGNADASVKLAGGDLTGAVEQLEGVIASCEGDERRMVRWDAISLWSAALRLQGRYSEALERLTLSLPGASQSQDPRPYVRLLLATAWCEVELSRLGRAQECTDELAAIIHRGEHLHLRLEAGLLNGRIALASGQYQQAVFTLHQTHQSARKANLVVLSEHARAGWAEATFALGDPATSASLFQASILGLMGCGDVPALAEGIRGRARTQARERDPEELFRPVASLLDAQPAHVLRLEQLLARAAHSRSKGRSDDVLSAHREAAMVLNRVATKLNATDRAALRVHPWSAWIRRGLR